MKSRLAVSSSTLNMMPKKITNGFPKLDIEFLSSMTIFSYAETTVTDFFSTSLSTLDLFLFSCIWEKKQGGVRQGGARRGGLEWGGEKVGLKGQAKDGAGQDRGMKGGKGWVGWDGSE